RAMTLDPACPEGREIVKKLVATADVVVANLPPEVLRSLSLDLESLRRGKPDIILTTVAACGAGGPWSGKHGFDGIGQVMCGSAYLTGTPEQPYRAAVAWVDCGTASLAAFGTLAALMGRQKTGPGQKGGGGVPAHGGRLQQSHLGRAGGGAPESHRHREPRADLGALRSLPHQGRVDHRLRHRQPDVQAVGAPHGRGALARRSALRGRPRARG